MGAKSQPVIVTVDDDPEVLAAVERDLRQHYRRDYRIVKASSGKEALEAARELKKRGVTVALFVADQRMPEMTGTDFLSEARKLHPRGREGVADGLRRYRGGDRQYQRDWA